MQTLIDNLKLPGAPHVEPKAFALQHIESGEYVCLLINDVDHLACFSDPDTAIEFQIAIMIVEHTDVVCKRLAEFPFEHFWLDGKCMTLAGGSAKEGGAQ